MQIKSNDFVADAVTLNIQARIYFSRFASGVIVHLADIQWQHLQIFPQSSSMPIKIFRLNYAIY